MKNKFLIARNFDSDEFFYEALVGAGFVEVFNLEAADFILHDAVHPGLDAFLKLKPSFIYPHTPQSWFLWDGILEPAPVRCNFVYGDAGVQGMKAYGYPYRVESVGFGRSAVREFRPTTGNDLLIIPSHPLQRGQYTYGNYIEWVMSFLRFVIKNRNAFGRITLCWNETRVDPALWAEIQRQGVNIIPTNPYVDANPLKNMMERMEEADLVVSCGTAGCVSAALGKPTVFFSELEKPRSIPRWAANPEKYLDLVRFPLQAENMTIDQIMAVRTTPNPFVEYWKQQNIGGPFNAEKFIRIVRECLQ